MTSTVSFTVKDQSVREHLIIVHGYSSIICNALAEDARIQQHEEAHAKGLNMLVEHTHGDGILKRVFEGG